MKCEKCGQDLPDKIRVILRDECWAWLTVEPRVDKEEGFDICLRVPICGPSYSVVTALDIFSNGPDSLIKRKAEDNEV
jgi:hypothetical protein